MPRWWRAGFASVLLVTIGALGFQIALREPNTDAAQVEKSLFEEHDSLVWSWGPDGRACEIYDHCAFIEVLETARCVQQLSIELWLEDAKENLVATVPLVMNSPRQGGPTLIEVGVNRDDFEYFVVGAVQCTKTAPTVEAEL